MHKMYYFVLMYFLHLRTIFGTFKWKLFWESLYFTTFYYYYSIIWKIDGNHLAECQ